MQAILSPGLSDPPVACHSERSEESPQSAESNFRKEQLLRFFASLRMTDSSANPLPQPSISFFDDDRAPWGFTATLTMAGRSKRRLSI